ncbi:class I SAM-dependent methyltransferase [Nocardiopsis rhodophaea]|uniref:Class I SAM-dependent methyltransferase n=1 Tax=Nocardiopsis rhodophaea TaxID=280238 RepID=A0ABN2TEU2_9ACTN
MNEEEWRRFLAEFHHARPAITEHLLGRADAAPYAWVAAPLRPVSGPVVDLACGSAPTRTELPGARWVGLDSSPKELLYAAARRRGPLVRADTAALPFGRDTVAGVCAAMSLQVVSPLDAVLREVHRVLRPGGVVATLTPARLGTSPAGLWGWLRVLRSVGVLRLPWPNPQACDKAADVLRAHGFAVVTDERRVFQLDMSTREATRLLLHSLYLPGVDAERLAAAEAALGSWARPGRTLPLPLRRVVARLPERLEAAGSEDEDEGAKRGTGEAGEERPAA